jgi:hypothetical protein
MSKKTTPEQGQSSLPPFVQVHFKGKMGRVDARLFGDEFMRLAPKKGQAPELPSRPNPVPSDEAREVAFFGIIL